MPVSTGVLSAAELTALVHPEKEIFLWPLITSGSLGLIYAKAGVGKSYLGLWLSAALAACGDFLGWKCTKAAKVFYIDGEMGSGDMQKRFDQIVEFGGFDGSLSGNWFVTSPNLWRQQMVPDIGSSVGQTIYEQRIKELGINVLFIDNLLTTLRLGAKETDVQAWTRVQTWLVKLRAMGLAVVLIHHAGKSGSQLGTSQREVILNWIINLARPIDYEMSQGARFEVHFEKCRDLEGSLAEPISVAFNASPTSVSWSWNPLKDYLKEKVMEMDALHMTARQIAESIGRPLYVVKKILADGAFEVREDVKTYERELF